MIVRMVSDLIHNKLGIDSPRDTGNLADNGISDLMMINSNAIKFTMGGQPAPYGVPLNELAIMTTRAKSQYKNIHYTWYDTSIDDSIDQAANMLGGRVERS